MVSPEKPFGKRVEERAERYQQKTAELAKNVTARMKRGLELLAKLAFYVIGGSVEAGIVAANEGKEAFRAAVEAIKKRAKEAMEFGRNKKEQAANLLRSAVEAAKNRMRNAREALVNGVNEARSRVEERIREMRKARERVRIEEELRKRGERLNEIDAEINRLLDEKARLERGIYDLNQRWRQLQQSPESPSSAS